MNRIKRKDLISAYFDLQPTLENALIKIQPLDTGDFEKLYKIASDPLIWEQHPEKERYKRETFKKFFDGAIDSKGAFLIFDNKTGMPIGSSRYYDYNPDSKSVAIGFTFIARDHWGTTFNRALKTLMMDHAFRYVNTIIFHIGSGNIRSQKSVEKFGAIKTGEMEMEFHGRGKQLNFVYEIDKENWETMPTMNNEQ